MKLHASTENKITKDKNGKNMPHLEITEAVLVHCNPVNNDYQHNSRVLHLIQKKTQSFHLLKYCLLIKITNC